MKKLFLFILAFVYITTSTGAVVHLHYCMGELDNWWLVANDSKTCGKCGMEELKDENNSCCKNEQKIVKNDSDQKITQVFSPVLNLLTQVLPEAIFEVSSLRFFATIKRSPTSRALLKFNAVAIYVRNCVFLI